MKVIIFVNEFFGEWNTARGGYGFIAKNLLPQALNIPHNKITICIGRSKSWIRKEVHQTTDGFTLIKLPKSRFLAARIVNKFDAIVSIEATVDYLFSLKNRLNKKIIFWIQDPRPQSDWDEINTVKLAKEPSYWNPKTYALVNECYNIGLIKFVTQANYLKDKAKILYNLPTDARIEFLPNPLPQLTTPINKNKENAIIFLGRIDSVKRGWLFCEIAKRMTDYSFYVLGASTNSKESMANNIINEYRHLDNLHFMGHVEGLTKTQLLNKAKVLVNTSIHEALPVSFLEAFQHGVIVCSNQNPDNLTEKYGRYIGKSIGDGWSDVDKYVENIRWIIEHENERVSLANKAKAYVDEIHSNENFRKIFKNILEEIQ